MIDTAAKRAAALLDFQPLPAPDGEIDATDRQSSIWIYGIVPAVVESARPGNWLGAIRKRQVVVEEEEDIWVLMHGLLAHM